jgi:hypothetical protein
MGVTAAALAAEADSLLILDSCLFLPSFLSFRLYSFLLISFSSLSPLFVSSFPFALYLFYFVYFLCLLSLPVFFSFFRPFSMSPLVQYFSTGD